MDLIYPAFTAMMIKLLLLLPPFPLEIFAKLYDTMTDPRQLRRDLYK